MPRRTRIQHSPSNVKRSTLQGPEPSRRTVRALVPQLIDWFTQHARDLPWRRTLDPYGIWVSEIMLQQTQVKTVTPYWERWMRELPNIHALAKASPDRVLKLWEGLGYYTRARNLQKAARLIVADGGHSLPATFEGILTLPGVGRYTAGAICSIAFNLPTPIVDGNVVRVLTRVFGIADDPRTTFTNRRLWEIATALVAHAGTTTDATATLNGASVSGACSLLNQSLMELGALICTTGQPRCNLCPLRRRCVARRLNRAEDFPRIEPPAKAVKKRFAAFLVEHRGRWLVRQRPAGVVNAHLWEFPNSEMSGDRQRPHELVAREFGSSSASIQPLRTIRHSITRYRITLDALAVRLIQPPRSPRAKERWLTRRELDAVALTGAHRKLANLLTKESALRR